MSRSKHLLVVAALAPGCDSGGGETDTDGGFDPTFDGGGGQGQFIPTAGGSSATFTGGGGGTSTTGVTTTPVTSASNTNVTTVGDDSTSGGGSATCNLDCIDSSQCEAGESCLTTANGMKCLPLECADCFDQNGTCYHNNFDCSFADCEFDPDNTCENPCSDASACNAGQSCFNLTSGMQCAPLQCQQCFDVGQSCSWNTADCSFAGCMPA